MADAPKRKKLERLPEVVMPQSNTKFVCCRCGTAYSRQKGYFPVSHSPMYRGAGFLPICSDCVDGLYEHYRDVLSSDREAMRRVCMKLDLYWSDNIYDMTEKAAGVHSRVRNYIGKTNLLRFIDKTFDDTLQEEALNGTRAPSLDVSKVNDQNDNEDSTPSEEEEEPIPQELLDFWGDGYPSLSIYKSLDRRYHGWIDERRRSGGENNITCAEVSLYKNICILEETIARDSAQGKPIDKNVNALNTLLGSMNLKPAQQKDEQLSAELEKMPLGVGIEKWETLRPLPRTPDSLKDQSKLAKNITTWFFGHTCKMVGLKNSYCKQYDEAIEELRVKHPEYDSEDDDAFLDDVFNGIDISPDGSEENNE